MKRYDKKKKALKSVFFPAFYSFGASLFSNPFPNTSALTRATAWCLTHFIAFIVLYRAAGSGISADDPDFNRLSVTELFCGMKQ